MQRKIDLFIVCVVTSTSKSSPCILQKVKAVPPQSRTRSSLPEWRCYGIKLVNFKDRVGRLNEYPTQQVKLRQQESQCKMDQPAAAAQKAR